MPGTHRGDQSLLTKATLDAASQSSQPPTPGTQQGPGLYSSAPTRQVSRSIPPTPAPAPGRTHLKLGSWAEVTSEPLSDVPMVRSYPSWKGASANTAPGGRDWFTGGPGPMPEPFGYVCLYTGGKGWRRGLRRPHPATHIHHFWKVRDSAGRNHTCASLGKQSRRWVGRSPEL